MKSAIGTLTRRAFLSLATLAGVGSMVGCPRPTSNGKIVFRRSGRGLHVSNAAKKQNANRFYRTRNAALGDAPHPGDNSKVVEITISQARFDQLFGGGNSIADLRIKA